MKKFLSLMVVIMILFTGAMASAEGDVYQKLGYSAIVSGDKLYYSGSVDGTTTGLFIMNLDGSDVQRLPVDVQDCALLAVCDGTILIQDYSDGQYILLKADGTEITRQEGLFSEAVPANGSFYCGSIMVSTDGSGEKQLFEVKDGNENFYTALAVDGDYYYFLDNSEYGASMMEAGESSAKLCRLSLADGTVTEIGGNGSALIGIDDEAIYYTRTNFWYAENDDALEMKVDQGLFRAAKTDLSQTKLADVGEIAASTYTSYALVADGVVYGTQVSYSDDAEDAVSILKRIGADGKALDDIKVSATTLACVKDGIAYMLQPDGDMDGDSYVQDDHIMAVTLADGSEKAVETDSKLALYYTEADPILVPLNDTFYFMQYDMATNSEQLLKMKLDGTEKTILAKGFSWAGMEAEG